MKDESSEYRDEPIKIDVSPEMGMYKLLESYPYSMATALSEFVDNSIQAFLFAPKDQKSKLNEVLKIGISFDLKDKHSQTITIKDNGVGIDINDLAAAMKPASIPRIKHLSEFGIGMKAASIWIGRKWTLSSTPLTDNNQYTVDFDLDKLLASNESQIDVIKTDAKGIDSGLKIELTRLRDISEEEVRSAITELHDIYQIFLYRKKNLKFKFDLNGISGDLEKQEKRKAPKALNYPIAVVKKPVWSEEILAFKYGKKKKWYEEIKFDFDGHEVIGNMRVRETLGQSDNPGIVLFRHNRMIKGSKSHPNRAPYLLGSQNKAAPSKIYMELHLDNQKIDHTKGKFTFDEKRFLDVLRNQPFVEEFIKQAEAHRPRYEDKNKVQHFKTLEKLEEYLKKKLADHKKKKKTGTKKSDDNDDQSSKSGSKNINSNNPNTTGSSEHNQNWHTLLPYPVSNKKKIKISALIDEATRAPLDLPYSVSMLLRSLMEQLLVDFVRDEGHVSKVNQMVFNEKKANGRPLTDEQKKTYKPGAETILNWLKKNHEAFPSEVRREVTKATQKYYKHKGSLNGVVHEGDLTNSSTLRTIRDDTYPLLEFLLSRINEK